jgi:hypothetical protein
MALAGIGAGARLTALDGLWEADQVVTGQTGGGIRVQFRKSQWVVPGLRRPEVPALVQASVSVLEADDVLRCSASVIWPPVSSAENQSEWLQLMAA